METGAAAVIAILTATVAALVLFIINKNSASVHTLRTEVQVGFNSIRTEITSLAREVGALQERTRLYEHLDRISKK